MELDPSLAVLATGRVFHGRYEVVRCIRAGGMGAVYEVIHLETRRRRALKIMLPSFVANADMHARFRLEATVAADIESEHIVETFDAGVDKDTGAPFLVMELLRGEDLLAVLSKRKRLPPAEVVELLAQAASALDKTHAAGVVHRDLKPDNLFVARRDDGAPKLKILDFGIAKVVSESGQPAARTRILGTPLYMSPEQIRGDGSIGPRADLYALGHIAFALLTGEAYWTEESEKDQLYALMMKIVAGAHEPASALAERYGASLPPEFDAWFARATASEPTRRFASASELVVALAEVFGIAIPRISAMPAVGASAPRDPSDPLLDAGGTRALPDPVASSGGTAASPAAAISQRTMPLPQGLVASQPSRVSGDHAAKTRRSIVGAAAVVVALVAASVIGARFVVRSGPEAASEPTAASPPPPVPAATASAEPVVAGGPPPTPTAVETAAVTTAQPQPSTRPAANSRPMPATAEPLGPGKAQPRSTSTPAAATTQTPTAKKGGGAPPRSLD